LETTDLPVHRVAEHAGLRTAANLRRRLRDATGVAPDAYRRTFAQPVPR
jgi:transcriptional regulator GlxA family with amidase domain